MTKCVSFAIGDEVRFTENAFVKYRYSKTFFNEQPKMYVTHTEVGVYR
jgi:hypothetical protein